MSKKDEKVKKLKKAFKYLKKLMREDPNKAEKIGLEVVKYSFRYGPAEYEKIWTKVAKRMKEDWDSADDIVARAIRKV